MSVARPRPAEGRGRCAKTDSPRRRCGSHSTPCSRRPPLERGWPPPVPCPAPPERARLPRARAVSPAPNIVLLVDFEPSTEQREVQTLARDFARAEIEPHAAKWDREHRFPRELFVKLAELGLMGTCVPEEYGGAGTDFVSYILALEELSRADAGVGVTVAVHTSAVTLPLLAFGSDEQKSRFVPPLARGEHLGAFALTEAEAGSDAGALRTRAEPS